MPTIISHAVPKDLQCAACCAKPLPSSQMMCCISGRYSFARGCNGSRVDPRHFPWHFCGGGRGLSRGIRPIDYTPRGSIASLAPFRIVTRRLLWLCVYRNCRLVKAVSEFVNVAGLSSGVWAGTQDACQVIHIHNLQSQLLKTRLLCSV